MERINVLFDLLPQGVMICDCDGRLKLVNTAFESLTGYTKEELVKLRMWDMSAPGERKDFLPEYLRYLAKEQPPPTPYFGQNLSKDGRRMDVRINWTYIYETQENGIYNGLINIIGADVAAADCGEPAPGKQNHREDDDRNISNHSKGRLLGFACVVTDITHQKQAEEELLRTNREYQLISRCAQLLVRETREPNLLKDVCRLVVETGGYRMAWVGYRDEGPGQPVIPVAQEGFTEGYLEGLSVSWGDNDGGRGPTGRAMRSGETVFVRHLDTDPEINPQRLHAVQLGYASSIALPLKDDHGCFGALNIYSIQETAFDHKEVHLLEQLAADLAYGIVNIRTRERHQRAEEALKRAKEQLEQRVAERTKELRESEEKFKILSEKSMVGIYIIRDLEFKYINPAFARIFDYSVPELMQLGFDEVVCPPSRKKVNEKISKLMLGNIDYSHSQFQGIQKNGEVIFLEVYKASIRLENKPAIIGTLIDITQRKHFEKIILEKSVELEHLNRDLEERINTELEKRSRQERLLMQQSKLAAMGEMVGAIAHQWRQPLSTVGVSIQNMELAYKLKKLDGKMIEKYTKDAMKQIKYMSRTIDDFRNFFKPSKSREAFCLKESIAETVSIMSSQMENHFIHIHYRYQESDVFKIVGYPNEFKQVLVNIFNNAKNAIVEKRRQGFLAPDAGDIFVDISRVGDEVVLDIANNGGSIPEELMHRIFEPYFSTLPEGKGMGIGLYMCKIIVEDQMRGVISVKNCDEGALFTIRLKGSSGDELGATKTGRISGSVSGRFWETNEINRENRD